MPNTDNPLKILGIHENATFADVRERYRILCLKYHPDKNPGNEEIFKAISEAYAKIRSNPSLLRPQTTGPASYLDGVITITMRDVYYAEEKSIKFQRTSICRQCQGTGSRQGKSGICQGCGGQGIIESSALSLFDMGNICPLCKGSGISGEPCHVCLGEKIIKEEVTAKFRATLHVYYNRHVLLKGFGNAKNGGGYEDLMVRVHIHQDPYVTIESNYFKVYVYVTPAQKSSGDDGVLELFGRKIPYHISPGSSEVYVTDHIRGDFTRTIRVVFLEYVIDPTPELTMLYKPIKDLEKRLCSQIGRLVMTKCSFPSTPQTRPHNVNGNVSY